MQNDVNGFPRAGAMALLDRGIRYLFSGINEDSGGPPLPRPSAFWWKMPDGRRLFVYLNYSLSRWATGSSSRTSGGAGPVPRAGDTRYRPPRAGDFLPTDEASVRKAHRHSVERIAQLGGGRLSLSARWCSRSPTSGGSTTTRRFPPLADFVAAWNRLGLKPDAAADHRQRRP